jgi:hypothetical protein
MNTPNLTAPGRGPLAGTGRIRDGRRVGNPAMPTAPSTAPAARIWVVANRLAGHLVSVLVVSDPGAAFALVTVLRKFWPQLHCEAVSGLRAVALIAEEQEGRGDRDGG